jgi:hypothetical protein
MRMSATLSTKLVTVEELLITNQFESDKSWQLPEDPISWRRFLHTVPEREDTRSTTQAST